MGRHTDGRDGKENITEGSIFWIERDQMWGECEREQQRVPKLLINQSKLPQKGFFSFGMFPGRPFIDSLPIP